MELWKFAEVEEDCVKMVLEGCPYSVYLAIHTQWGGASSAMYNFLRVIKAVTGLKIYQPSSNNHQNTPFIILQEGSA